MPHFSPWITLWSFSFPEASSKSEGLPLQRPENVPKKQDEKNLARPTRPSVSPAPLKSQFFEKYWVKIVFFFIFFFLIQPSVVFDFSWFIGNILGWFGKTKWDGMTMPALCLHHCPRSLHIVIKCSVSNLLPCQDQCIHRFKFCFLLCGRLLQTSYLTPVLYCYLTCFSNGIWMQALLNTHFCISFFFSFFFIAPCCLLLCCSHEHTTVILLPFCTIKRQPFRVWLI